MKAKNILMSILLVMGSIAAKAAGYPPELALVSQPVMVYNYNSITVYYDVENIGDYTYRGYVSLYLDPDYGYNYAEKYVRVYPGRIKRIAIDIPMHRIDRRRAFTIMPYYELGDELYSFTTFEYFDPISFYWDGPRTERWVVITVPPRPHYYHRPGTYRYYYDGYRPPMPPPGHGPGMPPPMNPKYHTYGYHYNNGGYPATHNEWTEPAPGNNEPAPSATVRPKDNGGSMSSGSYNSGTSSTGSGNNGSVSGSNGGSNSRRPKVDNGSTTGSTSGHNSSGTSSSSGRTGNGTSTRPNTNSSSSGRTGTTGSSSGRVNNSNDNSRPSGTSGSSSGRVNNSSSNTRSSGTRGSSSSRVGNSNNGNTRSSGNSSSNGSSTKSSSSNSRSGSGNGRR